MRLWSYQHPAVLETLQRGERYTCQWDRVPGERWQSAFRWMGQQMAERGIRMDEHAPVWAWHSVNRVGGQPDDLCARALLSDCQLEEGINFLELEVPDHLVLASCYGVWNKILYDLMDGILPTDQDVTACFTVPLSPRRGRPPHHFPGIQACFPYIEPDWLIAGEPLDTQKILQEWRAIFLKSTT